MKPLEEHLVNFLVINYFNKEKAGKTLEVGLYKVDENDIKFRVIKFVNGVLKEIFTTENEEEALTKFESLCKK
jgi:hypothetical protein